MITVDNTVAKDLTNFELQQLCFPSNLRNTVVLQRINNRALKAIKLFCNCPCVDIEFVASYHLYNGRITEDIIREINGMSSYFQL